MKYEFLFPFNEVSEKDNILIYGAGKVGKQYLEQISAVDFCNCLCVIDRNYKKYEGALDAEVCGPEDIRNLGYDKIVIASMNSNDEIYNSLLSLHIPKEKIVKSIYVNTLRKDIVFINDYDYTPKHRSSLENSHIGNILNEWYADNKEDVLSLVGKFFSFKQQYRDIPFHSSQCGTPQWDNWFIPPFDAMSIYGFLAVNNPQYFVEIGSGNTTLFAAQSIRDNNLRTKIISIDPFPRADIDKLCHKIYRLPLEEMDMSFFSELSSEDILLVDNSHRSFPNSDVTVFFTEILPKLPSGLLYALHDIFLPNDYPEVWSFNQRRWYNEQYLLCSYLLGGGDGDRIKCPNAFLSMQREVFDVSEPLFGRGGMFETEPHGGGLQGGFFWIEKA